MEKKDQNNQEERIGAILRAGFKSRPVSDEDFVRGVMHRVDELAAAPAFPPFLWAIPAALVFCLAVSLAWNLTQSGTTQENTALEEMLLIDMPAETQSLLTRSPSATNILWSNPQGGLLP